MPSKFAADFVCPILFSTTSSGLVTSVAYHGGSSHFFGIGVYPVSDWLGMGILGRYRSPLFCIVPPFFP
jgi:hypothetical protein